MVSEDEDYFARENEVFNAFCSRIQEELEAEEAANIYVDATHLNEKARNKVLNRLDLRNADLYAVDFNMPLDVCLKQNKMRSGRAFVPESQVRRMWYSYEAPTENEKYKYTVLHAVEKEEVK
jgi:predicted kinase